MEREDYKLVPLAAVGALQGFLRYYVQPELTAKRAWLGIGLGVLAYEAVCPKGELLSEGVDRALDKHRSITTLAIGVTALHLLNVLPEKVDPFSQVTKILKN